MENFIVGAVLAVIAGGITFFLSELQHQKHEREKREGDAMAVLSSIKAELILNWDLYTSHAGARFDERMKAGVSDKEPLNVRLVPTKYNEFIVYEANVSKLGDLENEPLRISIVRIMALLRGQYECLYDYATVRDNIEEATITAMTSPHPPIIAIADHNLRAWMESKESLVNTMMRNHSELLRTYPVLVRGISDEESRYAATKHQQRCWLCDRC